jgi:hypothetical protein
MVTYAEAFEIAHRMTEFITNAGGPVSLADIQSQLTKEATATKYKVAFFAMKVACAVGAAIVIGIIIRELDPCTNKNAPEPGCPQDNKQDATDGKKTSSTGWKQIAPPGAHEANFRRAA